MVLDVKAEEMQGDEIFMDDKGMVLFCIDISGSMGTAVEVEGQINFPPVIVNKVCYNRPSRMQAAVYHQLEVMRERVPNSHPGVVTFGTAVTAYGDGSVKKILSKQQDLNSVDVMFKLGEEYVKQAQLPASKSIPTLLKLIETIPTEGMTALGPGVVFSLGMASKYPGSKLMVCTDGAANVGCGKVGGKKEQEKQEVHPILFEKFDTGMIQTKP